MIGSKKITNCSCSFDRPTISLQYILSLVFHKLTLDSYWSNVKHRLMITNRSCSHLYYIRRTRSSPVIINFLVFMDWWPVIVNRRPSLEHTHRYHPKRNWKATMINEYLTFLILCYNYNHLKVTFARSLSTFLKPLYGYFVFICQSFWFIPNFLIRYS